MTPSDNLAIIAAAGSRKTQYIVDQVVADTGERILVTTYTNANLDQLQRRLCGPSGLLPSKVRLMSWFTFLMNEGARPYQRAILDQPNVIGTLNFVAARSRYDGRNKPLRYFLDSNRDIYRDGLSQFAYESNRLTGGLVIDRLAEMFDHIYIDEVQDLVGWDLEFLDALLKSSIRVTMVGDPRQHTFATNNSPKNKQFRGVGFMNWLAKRVSYCNLEPRTTSYRCHQSICDWADRLYPDLPATISRQSQSTDHDGIFSVKRSEVADYVNRYSPVVLRYSIDSDTMGYSAINFGMSKGSTYDRVLIFPTQSMLQYYETLELAKLKSKDRLYVAVTRAKYSVGFVVPD